MCSHGIAQTIFCGSGSFKHMVDRDDDDEDDKPCNKTSPGGGSSPKRPSKKKAGSKNPYAGRGLDKFSSVQSELEARREKIMASAGSEGIAMVRFMHSSSREWVPIVVRLRDHSREEQRDRRDPGTKGSAVGAPQAPPAPPAAAKEAAKERGLKQSFSWGGGGGGGCGNRSSSSSKEEGGIRGSWRGRYYWIVVMVLILACLLAFGRVFAICCTSIWWYLIPTLKGEEGNSRKSMKKKDYGRRVSAKGSNINIVHSTAAPITISHGKKISLGLHESATSPRAHANGKRG